MSLRQLGLSSVSAAHARSPGAQLQHAQLLQSVAAGMQQLALQALHLSRGSGADAAVTCQRSASLRAIHSFKPYTCRAWP